MRTQSAITEQVRQVAQDLLDVLTRLQLTPPGDSTSDDTRYRSLAAALDECLDRLKRLELWGPENRLPSSELWNAAGHLLERGWLLKQARTKPRGYAGDFEMLARIYADCLCDDPLGRLLDRYFQDQAAPQAVRNRMRMMAEWIVERATIHPHPNPLPQGEGAAGETCSPKHVAIVGSAFGMEVRDALLRLDPPARERVHLTLLDVDPAAIESAREQLKPLLTPARLTAVSANLFRLPDRPQMASLLDGADLLLCPGLFDYLDDSAAVAMLRALYARLAPDGRLTVFQFAPHNPTRAYMEWLGKWYLIYRDAEMLRALVQAVGIPDHCLEFGAEPLGVDLYVTAWRRH